MLGRNLGKFLKNLGLVLLQCGAYRGIGATEGGNVGKGGKIRSEGLREGLGLSGIKQE